MAQATRQRPVPSVRAEPSPKWVRARVAGAFVADTRNAKLVYQGPRPITYAVPVDDLAAEHVVDPSAPRDHPVYGRIRDASLRVGNRTVDSAVRFIDNENAADGRLAGHAVVRWDRIDAWYEEDEEVYVHPRDPHHRIDILQSSRHVTVDVDGERVAESRRPALLFETGLPPRYYLPQVDVRLDLLRPSDTVTWCPYKGQASYHHVEVGGTVHDDLVWAYRTPFPESHKVQGLFAFFNERVDLTVDGASQERPRTPWSRD